MTDDNLDLQIAQHVFGWQWRADWEAWCPPEWPPYAAMVHPPYADRRAIFERHGGMVSLGSGGVDERGRPLIPPYQYGPESIRILWKWLHAQPRLQSVRFVPLPVPPGSLVGAQPWRCEITLEGERVVHGEGNGYQGALCRAVLAVVTQGGHAPQ